MKSVLGTITNCHYNCHKPPPHRPQRKTATSVKAAVIGTYNTRGDSPLTIRYETDGLGLLGMAIPTVMEFTGEEVYAEVQPGLYKKWRTWSGRKS